MVTFKGLLIIISGPSGVGKSSVRKTLMEKHPQLNLVYSISMTTREPRVHEVEGEDYFFVTEQLFDSCLKAGNFLEHATFVGHKYGTPKQNVDKLREAGKNVILEIEVEGANQVMQACKGDEGLLTIFLMPPSFAKLEERIRGRRSETDDVIKERLTKARNEIELTNKYMYTVINETIEQAADEIANIISKKLRNR